MSGPSAASSAISGNPVERQRFVRITVLAKRNKNMSEDQFHEHWSTTHAQKASAHLAKYGIVSYKQYHTPSSLRKQLAKALPSIGGDAEKDSMIADYDGFVELLMPDLSCYEKMIQDPYYKDVIAPDETEFADWNTSRITLGWEEVYVQDGKVVNLDGGEKH